MGKTKFVPGLTYPVFGEYKVRDVEFVATFDVNKRRIGRGLSEAMIAEPNRWQSSLMYQDLVKVLPSSTVNGVAKIWAEEFIQGKRER